MHAAFRQRGREAIDKVMRTQPAVFLKLLVLLVPRQMTLDHSGGVKEMTDEQIERGIELIKEMLAQREAGANAKVIDGVPEPVPALLPPPDGPNKVIDAAHRGRREKAQAGWERQGAIACESAGAREMSDRLEAIFEELRSAIFAAYAATVEEDRGRRRRAR
jgi:hypothetical protein